jgi:preprotein translocase subunit SecG
MHYIPAARRLRKNAMQSVLLVAETLVAVIIIVLVLLQRSEGGALGMGGGGGGMGSLFSPRGAADTLTRATAIMAFVFFVICIGLNILALRGRPESSRSLLNQPSNITRPATAPAQPAPALPSVPKPQ